MVPESGAKLILMRFGSLLTTKNDFCNQNPKNSWFLSIFHSKTTPKLLQKHSEGVRGPLRSLELPYSFRIVFKALIMIGNRFCDTLSLIWSSFSSFSLQNHSKTTPKLLQNHSKRTTGPLRSLEHRYSIGIGFKSRGVFENIFCNILSLIWSSFCWFLLQNHSKTTPKPLQNYSKTTPKPLQKDYRSLTITRQSVAKPVPDHY